jgi:antitoxin (DNA-binding transcriptional repressor) of toxin-antitoxin stability system
MSDNMEVIQMRFIPVRDFRGKSAQVWKQLEHEKNMIITLNGRPIALLTKIKEDKMDETLSSVRRALVQDALTSIQLKSVEKGLDKLTAKEIEKEISSVRKKRFKC